LSVVTGAARAIRFLRQVADRVRPYLGSRQIVDAVKYSLPIVVPAFIVKLIELTLSSRASTFAANLPAEFLAAATRYVLYSRLLRLAVLVVATGWPLKRLLRIRSWLLALSLGLVIVVVALVARAAWSLGIAGALSSGTIQGAWQELQSDAAVWAADAWFFVAIVCAALLVEVAVRPRLARLLLYGSALVVSAAWLAFDLRYFLETRSVTSARALSYVLSSPLGVLVAAREATNVTTLLAMCGPPLMTFACVLYLRRARQTAVPVRATRLAAPAGALLLFLLASRFATPDANIARFASNSFFRLIEELAPAVTIGGSHSGRLQAAIRPGVPVERHPLKVSPGVHFAPYNVVIVLLESTRADLTSLYPPFPPSTPYMKSMAADSVVVDSMYAVIPRTSAAWVASLAGIFPSTATTVRAWQRLAVDTRRFDTSLALILARVGYQTSFITSAGLELENERTIVDAMGFDKIVSEHELDTQAFERIEPFGVDDQAMVQPTLSMFDESAASGKPFLLVMMSNVGHFPYNLPSTWQRVHFLGQNEFTDAHLNAAAYQDQFVRTVTEGLRSRGLLDNTVLIVLGDHGDGITDDDAAQRLYRLDDGLLHVPALIRFPSALHAVGHRGGLRQEIDLPATIFDALGLNVTGGDLPGLSLLSDLRGHGRLYFSSHIEQTYLAARSGNSMYLLEPTRRVMTRYDFGSASQSEQVLSVRRYRLGDSSDKPMLALEADILRWEDAARVRFLGAR
jgi:lipoteichoic acid synthase